MAPSQGYGPPKIEGVRAVRVGGEDALQALAPGAAGPSPRVRLEVRAEGFTGRAMPLLIRVGGRAYRASSFSADGKTVSFILDEIPPEGAVIEVGYPPHQMAELPERFSLSMLEDTEPGGGS
ncbi:MAG TPA: hypothetical protein VGS22_23970 [Thermoanaerobaculia bacterium]|jgi:hypothetical protein|nr:hypothetical protein [Thermoanaerobaculia bacterium]